MSSGSIDLGATFGGGGGGGGGSPSGPDQAVQYNNSGSFGGSSNFLFDGTNVTVFGSVTAGNNTVVLDDTGLHVGPFSVDPSGDSSTSGSSVAGSFDTISNGSFMNDAQVNTPVVNTAALGDQSANPVIGFNTTGYPIVMNSDGTSNFAGIGYFINGLNIDLGNIIINGAGIGFGGGSSIFEISPGIIGINSFGLRPVSSDTPYGPLSGLPASNLFNPNISSAHTTGLNLFDNGSIALFGDNNTAIFYDNTLGFFATPVVGFFNGNATIDPSGTATLGGLNMNGNGITGIASLNYASGTAFQDFGGGVINLTGTMQATSFSGDGSNLTGFAGGLSVAFATDAQSLASLVGTPGGLIYNAGGYSGIDQSYTDGGGDLFAYAFGLIGGGTFYTDTSLGVIFNNGNGDEVLHMGAPGSGNPQLSFFGAPLVAQQTGDIFTALSNYGLVTSPTISGVPVLKASNHLKAQTAAVSPVATYTPTATGTFQIGGYLTILAVSVDVIQLRVSYLDENNAGQTVNLFPQGLTSASLATTGVYLFPAVTIRATSIGAISVLTALTTGAGSISYDVGATITQIQ